MIKLAACRRIAFFAATAYLAQASDLEERQNPGFITALPTLASATIVVVTTTASQSTAQLTTSSPPSPPLPPNQQTTVPSPLPLTSTPGSTIGTIASTAVSTAVSTASSTASSTTASGTAVLGLATSVDAAQGPYFGGIPVTKPDVPIIAILLNLFLLGAVVHGVFYRLDLKRSGRAPKGIFPGLLLCFCLMRVLACTFRLAWVASSTSAAVIFLALILDQAGTTILFYLNYHMTKRMLGLFNIRLSLWAKSVVDSSTKIAVIIFLAVTFLLNALGAGLFEFSNGRDSASATSLVQASAALQLVFGLSLLGGVVLVRLSADQPRVDRLTAKMLVFLIGAGLLTMTSHLIRLAATFFIWKPISRSSDMILSKTMFYASGWGLEILMVAFYALTRSDLLFGPPMPLASVSESKTPGAEVTTIVESRRALALRMNPIRTVSGHDGRYGPWATSPDEMNHPAELDSTPVGTPLEKDGVSVESMSIKDVESAEPMADRRSMFIAISRSFSVSSKRLSNFTQ